MKEIKLRIVDWWEKDNEENFYNNTFVQILSKKYKVVYSNNPDYVIFGPFGLEHIKYINSVKIFISGENARANWDFADYAIDCDYIDFLDRHFRFPFAFWNYDYCNIQNINNRQELLKYKSKFCAFIVTSPSNFSPRDEFFKKLCNYKKVDSGGRHLNNIRGYIGDRYNDFTKSKIEWLKNYKFNICFENSYHPGYITEKIFQAFSAGCIPIYWGDPRIDDIINPKSYININKFSNFEEAIEYINIIDNNNDLFLKIATESVFKENIDYVKYFNDKCEEFLFSIFDQDSINAKRAYMHHRVEDKICEVLSYIPASNNKNFNIKYYLRHPKKLFKLLLSK
ncbi:glycosyltransferase, family 10 [Campylobacter sp. RM5004]|uniref:glycosyltransferase family 10 domain-containing protein n=1 Tax=Campylobacter sp. RM5004 TaxID=1660078 RepID=UPI001EFB45F7|nr:glycosyltransferase family 10 [Campylobacter sp. RM5004]ULO02443.1 glycosyltransferase, family 10 [Campylobacter sp. RM5004]